MTTWLWALYGIAPLLERPSRDFWSVARGTVVLANALLFGGVLWQLLAPDHVHLRGLVLAGARAGLRRRHARRRPRPAGAALGLELTRVAGVALAALAVPAQLDESWVTFGWTALAGVLLWADLRGAGRTYQYPRLRRARPVALQDGDRRPGRRSRGDCRRSRRSTNGGFLAGLGVVALLGALSVAYRRRAAPTPALSTALLIVALVLLLWKITLEIAFAYSARGLAMRIDLGPEALLTITLVWARVRAGRDSAAASSRA